MSARSPSHRLFASGLLLAVLFAVSGCTTYRAARLYQSGTEALDRGEVASAMAKLEAASELVPHASEIQNHLGLAYAAAGRRGDARRAFVLAIDLDCGNSAALHNLALVSGDPDGEASPFTEGSQ